jgi:hypothetical protein
MAFVIAGNAVNQDHALAEVYATDGAKDVSIDQHPRFLQPY